MQARPPARPRLRLKPYEIRPLVFLARHLAVGLLAAAGFCALLFASDLGGLRRLAWADEDGWLFLALLLFGLCITFGSVAMGASIMALGRERE
jgi:hypothetical protein